MTAGTVTDWLSLRGATAVVFGATGGLGQSITRGMAGAGMRLFVHGHCNTARLEDLKALPAVEAGALADVRSVEEVEDLCRKVAVWCEGSLDVVVYAVGVNPTAAPVTTLDAADWDQTIEVNLRGAFLTTKALLGPLRRSEAGKIVLISSIFSLQSPANRAAYGASKHGMSALVQSLVREEGAHIHINALAPGPVWGENVRHIFTEHANREGISVEDYTRQRTEKIPMRRFLDPEELSNAVLYMCSPRSSYINGQVIAVTGGAHE